MEDLRAVEGVRVVTYSRGTARLLPASGAEEEEDALADDDARAI
jgi:hypothetical protein